MADTVNSYTYADGPRNVVMHFTNVSDGTGESAVTKVDVSALADSPSSVKIEQIWATTSGMDVDVYWDADTDELLMTIPADTEVHLDFRCFGGLGNKAGTGVTGDIKFTTRNHAAGDAYSITLGMAKS